uniref:NADH-ubiquinone oxidoreductase chain 4L n=1 Tax=Proasellus parvulus TaxID=1282015 RepID=A0A485M7N0_9CRUS|nr:NADH dehydrogenase subunit 4l [Proasellus parvulus]
MFFAVLSMFVVGGLSFMFNKKHLLAALISLEYTVLASFIFMSMSTPLASSVSVPLAFITVSVCGGALGLSVLVLYTRSVGSDSLEVSIFSVW